MHPDDFLRRAPATSSTGACTTRDWLRDTHAELRELLPPDEPPALLTEDLVDSTGRPVDVFGHFGESAAHLASLWHNFFGLLHTAQAAGTDSEANSLEPPWPGYADYEIPVTADIALSGRLGLATRDGLPVRTDCIVLLPGLAGDNTVRRTRDIAEALRSHGFHVLALEQRRAGRTLLANPDVRYTFGTLEAGDLLSVSEWLQQRPEVRHTGLIGYCWGANIALLAAWESCRPAQHPAISPRLAPALRTQTGARHFEAGVLAFSPTLRFEEIIEALDQRRWTTWSNPVLKVLQDEIIAIQRRDGLPVNGSLRDWIEQEYARSNLSYPGSVIDGLAYLRFLPHRGIPAYDKLNCARMPVVIVHAVNDPLAPAQASADLMAQVNNPNVAAIVLPGGGHVGFTPYSRQYFYSLMLNFFDREYGAAACAR